MRDSAFIGLFNFTIISPDDKRCEFILVILINSHTRKYARENYYITTVVRTVHRLI